jgi:hypothetical protein
VVMDGKIARSFVHFIKQMFAPPKPERVVAIRSTGSLPLRYRYYRRLAR